MKFRYTGSDPLPEFFGFDWQAGSSHDVTDEHAIKKLSNSVLFERADVTSRAEKPAKVGKLKLEAAE